MKKILLSIGLFTSAITFSQFVSDFESPAFGSVDSSWWGQDQVTDGDTIYTNDDINYELNYNSVWQSYTGFAVSSWTDVVTSGYANQFSAIPGEGANNSSQYGICYVSPWSNNRLFSGNLQSNGFISIDVTNTTYAYQSMLNGDMFAKPFGADTSANGTIDGTNGEDWFLLTIYYLTDSIATGDSVNFYLADYRFADDSLDYIVDDWQTVVLPNSIGVNGLDFKLTSSDTTGGFGMNTPSYFAIDDVTTAQFFDIDDQSLESQIIAYPNPTDKNLTIQTTKGTRLELYDLNGRRLIETYANSTQVLWNLSDFESGIYMLVSTKDGISRQAKIIKY